MDRDERTLRREFAHAGGDQVEAALLSQRMRSGTLARERLELAAWLGHRAARLALGGPTPGGENLPFDRWAAALTPDDLARLRRVALEACAEELASFDTAAADLKAALEAAAEATHMLAEDERSLGPFARVRAAGEAARAARELDARSWRVTVVIDLIALAVLVGREGGTPAQAARDLVACTAIRARGTSLAWPTATEDVLEDEVRAAQARRVRLAPEMIQILLGPGSSPPGEPPDEVEEAGGAWPRGLSPVVAWKWRPTPATSLHAGRSTAPLIRRRGAPTGPGA